METLQYTDPNDWDHTTLRAWMRFHRLTQYEAADLLDASRRQIGYMATGQKPVTRRWALACMGLSVYLAHLGVQGHASDKEPGDGQ